MNKYHQEILEEIKKQSSKAKITKHPEGYSGSSHTSYNLITPKLRLIIKGWVTDNRQITLPEFITLLNSLNKGESHTEKSCVGMLVEYLPALRRQLDPKLLNTWLDNLVGWAEVDSLCQSNFTAKEMLENWGIWEKLIRSFSKDENISKRRAGLVLLTGPVGQSDDKRLADLAFENIDKLKFEKDILITKAISWLLRSLIRNHKDRVGKYLRQNLDTLPKIALRETQRKLLTGKK